MSSPYNWTFQYGLVKTRLSSGASYDLSYTNTGTASLLKTKSSVDTGFFVPGVYRVNPYSVGSVEIKADYIGLKQTVDDGSYKWDLDFHGSRFQQNLLVELDYHPCPSDSTFSKVALQKAQGNVSAANLELGVELGELRETLNMIRSPFKELRDYCDLKNFRRLRRQLALFLRTGDFRGLTGAAAFSAATSSWMEARYGLRPLIGSVQNVMKLARNGLPDIDLSKIQCAHGYSEGRAGIDRVGKRQVAGYYADLFAEFSITHKISASASVQFRYKDIPSLAKALGLAPENIPEIAWELTRLSFVVDWWYGIGPWLSSLRLNPEVEILGNTVGTKRQSTMRALNPSASLYGMELDPPDVDMVAVKSLYDRVVDQEWSGPQLILGRSMDWKQFIDGLVILYQNVKF